MYHNGFVIKINIHVSEVHIQVDKKKITYFFIGTSSVLTQRNSQLKKPNIVQRFKIVKVDTFIRHSEVLGTPRTFF